MSKVHLFSKEDETFFCSKCLGLGIERVIIRNPNIGVPEEVWKCKDCGCTRISKVDSFDEYMKICDNQRVDYIDKKNSFNIKF